MNIKHALIVIEDPAVNKPVIYGQVINPLVDIPPAVEDIIPAVEEFFEEKGIEVDYTAVEHIADAVTKGKHFWYDERYCFQIADIYS